MKFLFIILILLPCVVCSQEIPTRGDIFDYDIGDEFHFFTSNDNDCYIFTTSRRTVLDKMFSPNNDTVFYEFQYEKYWTIPGEMNVLDTFYEVSLGTVYYTDLLSPIENILSLDSTVVLSYDSLAWCDNTIVRFGWCEYCDELGSSYTSTHYGLGLGKVYHSYASSEESWTYVNMIYAHKINSGECGERDDRVLNTHFEMAESWIMHPNPTSDFLILSDQIHVDKMLCFDETGKLVSELRLSNNMIDVSHLQAGVYILLMFKDGLFVSKKFQKINF